MTSNLGSKLVLRGGRMGFGGQSEAEAFRRIEEEILAELKRSFSPEFINRVDEVIVFHPLGHADLEQIVEILLGEVNETLALRRLRVSVTPAAKAWLLERAGLDPSTGARPLRRTLQRHVQDAISELLIRAEGADIEAFETDVEGDELVFRTQLRELEPTRA
jgi:ATP-dependent Clp protease ATP-binding subunit ClpC